MSTKATIQKFIDRIQFYYDVFPGLAYQPLPWLGYSKANRGIGTVQRWEAIEGAVSALQLRSALDVGCNVGFFSMSLAQKTGIPVLGVELHPPWARMARHAASKAGIKNAFFVQMEVTPTTIRLLPHVDAVLCLSVYHHWCRYFGFQTGTEMLAQLWDRCAVTMFFETGEGEMPEYYNLPRMVPNSGEWLAGYLSDTCKGAEVRNLGQFKAFAPGGSETKNVVSRNLFQLVRP